MPSLIPSLPPGRARDVGPGTFSKGIYASLMLAAGFRLLDRARRG